MAAPPRFVADSLNRVLDYQTTFKPKPEPQVMPATDMANPEWNPTWDDYIPDDEHQIEFLTDLAKGVAVAPFTVAPDTVGLLAQIYNWSNGKVGEKFGIPERYMPKVPVISGDPIREFMGLDPDSVPGMIGEVFGNWEGLVAKAPVMASKIMAGLADHYPDVLQVLMKDDPFGTVLGSTLGARGMRNLRGEAAITRMRDAERRLANGDDPMTVLRETGWLRGSDGEMKVIISDVNTKVKTSAIEAKARIRLGNKPNGTQVAISFERADEVFDAPHIWKAYPELAALPIEVNLKKIGRNPDGSIKVAYYKVGPDPRLGPDGEVTRHDKGAMAWPNYGGDPAGANIIMFNLDDDAQFRSTLLHELQHGIQRLEGFSTGASTGTFAYMARNWLEARDLYTIQTAVEKLTARIDATDIYNPHQKKKMIKEILEETGFLSQNDGPMHLDWARERIEQYMKGWKESDEIERITASHLISQRFEQFTKSAAEQLRLGNWTQAQMIDWMKDPTNGWDEFSEAAFRRYLSAGGELEARSTQALRDKRLEEIYDMLEAEGTADPLDIAYRADPAQTAEYGKLTAKHGRYKDEWGHEMIPPSDTSRRSATRRRDEQREDK